MNAPGEPRRARRIRTGAIVLGALAVAAAGLTIGIRVVGSDSPAAPEPAAAADTPTAPKNTMSADVAAYTDTRVHAVHFDMTEKVVEIAPGKVVTLWTFGDRVPGPVVRVRVGDTVKASITNKTSMPHSIDGDFRTHPSLGKLGMRRCALCG